jgi:hypothetical protein
MDQVQSQDRLEQTERNISEAKRHIARLRELSFQLQRHDIRLTMKMLQQLECSLPISARATVCRRNSAFRLGPFIYKVRHSDAEHFQIVIRTYINPADAAVL